MDDIIDRIESVDNIDEELKRDIIEEVTFLRHVNLKVMDLMMKIMSGNVDINNIRDKYLELVSEAMGVEND